MGTHELCLLLKISPRQVQWWCEANLVRPVTTERIRKFDAKVSLEVAVIAELRRKGISLKRVRSLHLSELENSDFLVVQVHKRRHQYCSAAEVLPYVVKAPGACYVVCLSDLRARLDAKSRKAAA